MCQEGFKQASEQHAKGMQQGGPGLSPYFFEVASLAFGEHNDPEVSPGTSHQFVLEQLLQANLIQKFTIPIFQSKEATGRRLERCAG